MSNTITNDTDTTKKSKDNTVTINLNSPNTSALKKNEFVFYHNIKKVIELIESRIDEIKNVEKKYPNLTHKERFSKLRMHDAILIDGKRGGGKTTYLQNIKKVLKKKHTNSVKVLGAIDPNQLDEKSNILLLVIANIYTELLNSIKNDNGDRDQFNNLNIEINALTESIRTAENSEYKDSYDHLYALHKTLTIDERLHKFFENVCKFYGVQALVLPIDDIDMDFIHGYKVIDTIRKYLSTPKMIPLIALDSAQAYALVKKKHFEYFSYDARTKKSDIENSSELGFLRKLPNEYLQKILKPTRRIVVPDMLDIYKSHIRAKNSNDKKTDDDKRIVFKFTKGKTTFEINFDVLLKRYMNIVYGYDGSEIESPNHFRVVNYLKNKSLRSFFEDIIAFFNGFQEKEKGQFGYSTLSLKTRLNPNYMEKFSNRYDAIEWVWSHYIDNLNQIMLNYRKKKDVIGVANIVTPSLTPPTQY